MNINGLEIVKDKKLSKCFVIDDSYVAITDPAGDIKLVFNLNQNMNDVDEDIIEECKKNYCRNCIANSCYSYSSSLKRRSKRKTLGYESNLLYV